MEWLVNECMKLEVKLEVMGSSVGGRETGVFHAKNCLPSGLPENIVTAALKIQDLKL